MNRYPKIITDDKGCNYLYRYSNSGDRLKGVYLVKYANSVANIGVIRVGKSVVYTPKELVGKRIKLKIEIIEDGITK
jgi:hypothetical protein